MSVIDAATAVRPPPAAALDGAIATVPRRARTWPRIGTIAIPALVLASAAGVLLAWSAVRKPAAAAAPRAPTVQDPALRALVARCRIAMAGGVCRAMPASSDATSTPASPAAGPVFIVGFGAVDAAIVARLNRDGEAMCDTVAATCQATPGDALCRVARALYP